MPVKLTVKIKSIESQDRGGKDGYVIKGYDATNEKAFNKFIFETTQKGEMTKVAEVMQSANAGEWYEFTCDDSKWANATYAVQCQAPEGGEPPANYESKSSGGGGGYKKSSGGGGHAKGGDGMSKEEWAAKDAKRELSIHRQSALKQAVLACTADGTKITKPKLEQIEKMALRFTSFLQSGDFDGKPGESAPPAVKPEVVSPEETTAVDNTPTGGGDDDIPF